jgi:hypothetical protein
MPLNRSAPNSGSRKYTAVTNKITQRHAGTGRLRRVAAVAAAGGAGAS